MYNYTWHEPEEGMTCVMNDFVEDDAKIFYENILKTGILSDAFCASCQAQLQTCTPFFTLTNE